MHPSNTPLETFNNWRELWLRDLFAGNLHRQFELFAVAVSAITAILMLVAPDALLLTSELVCISVTLSALVAHHFKASWRVALTWLVWLAMQATIFIGVYLQGGLWSLATGYFFVSGVPILMILNLRSVFISASITALLIAILAWMEFQGLAAPSVIPPSNFIWPITLFISLMLGFILLPFISYEIQRQIARQLKSDNLALKQAQQELLKQHRVQEQFVASVSHELRTPMNAIVGFLQTIDREQGFSTNELGMLDQMEQASQQLLLRINELLDFSQLRAGKMRVRKQAMNLGQELTQLVGSLRKEVAQRPIELNLEMPAELGNWRMGDPERINQVVHILLDNSLKFTKQGKVCVRVSELKPPIIQIAVSDTGPGIPESELERVFNRLSTITSRTRRELGGTGLGLSIAQALAELLNGSLRVESQVGQGSTFFFNVPLEPTTSPDHAEIAPNEKTCAECTGTVLIVDDSPINRLVAQNLLRAELPAIKVLEAESGAQALEILDHEIVNLILMDVIMPNMSGTETTQQIRGKLKQLAPTVIALTADTSEDMKKQCQDAGMQGIIYKPFNKEILRQNVLNIIQNNKI